MQIAIRHPDLVSKIVIESANYKREGLILVFFDGFLDAMLEEMRAPLKDNYIKLANDKSGLQIMFDKDKARMLYFKNITDGDLRFIKAPSLPMALL